MNILFKGNDSLFELSNFESTELYCIFIILNNVFSIIMCPTQLSLIASKSVLPSFSLFSTFPLLTPSIYALNHLYSSPHPYFRNFNFVPFLFSQSTFFAAFCSGTCIYYVFSSKANPYCCKVNGSRLPLPWTPLS